MKYLFVFLTVVFMACSTGEQDYLSERSNNADVVDTVSVESEVAEIVTEGIVEDKNTELEDSIVENQSSIESNELVEEQQKSDPVEDIELESKPVNTGTGGIVEDQNFDLEDSVKNNQSSQESNPVDEEQQGADKPQSLPDISYFATNKSWKTATDLKC